MKAVEFETELHGQKSLTIPQQVAAQLPATGKARVIMLVEDDSEDTDWRQAAYAQFVREDSPEDSVYDKYGPVR